MACANVGELSHKETPPLDKTFAPNLLLIVLGFGFLKTRSPLHLIAQEQLYIQVYSKTT